MTKITEASKLTVGRKGKVCLNKSDSVSIPSQNVELDPRSKTETLKAARNYIATGDKVTIKGTGKARKQTATWY